MPKQCKHPDCANPVFSKMLCKWHYKLPQYQSIDSDKKVPQKPSKEARKPIAKQSPKRKKLDALYNIMAAQFKKDKPYCMARLNGCTGKADHTHHLYAGASRDKYYLDSREWINCCENCHHQIHSVLGKEELYKLGLKKTY